MLLLNLTSSGTGSEARAMRAGTVAPFLVGLLQEKNGFVDKRGTAIKSNFVVGYIYRMDASYFVFYFHAWYSNYLPRNHRYDAIMSIL